MTIVALLVGGTVGVLARYVVSLAVFGVLGGGPHGRMMLMTGFCGAYTTFSALILELDLLMRTAPLRGAAYVLLSVAAGLALFRAGALLGAR